MYWKIISKIFLSALLYNFAFFFPETIGFLILFYWIPLYYLFKLRLKFIWGFLWGLFIYIPHCFWLLLLLLTKSQASIMLSCMLYTIVIIYLGVISGLWFLLHNIFRQKSYFFYISIFFYYVLLERYILWFLDMKRIGEYRYPFFSPFIPLASYKSLLKAFLFSQTLFLEKIPYQIIHLKPDVSKETAEEIGHQIYHEFSRLNLNNIQPTIIVAPESIFPFDLEKYQHIIELWSSVLPKNTHMFIGACYSKQVRSELKWYQSVYHINIGRIIQRYDKKILVPLVEKQTWPWEKYLWSKGLFLNNKREFNEGDSSITFNLPHFKIQPIICSEIFLGSEQLSENIIFTFINDSWFHPIFQTWMKNYIKLLSIKKPIIYIGFKDLKINYPF